MRHIIVSGHGERFYKDCPCREGITKTAANPVTFRCSKCGEPLKPVPESEAERFAVESVDIFPTSMARHVGLLERIQKYRAGMKPYILAILQGPHAMSGGAPSDIAEHIMDSLSRAGFVCAGPTVERIAVKLRTGAHAMTTQSPGDSQSARRRARSPLGTPVEPAAGHSHAKQENAHMNAEKQTHTPAPWELDPSGKYYAPNVIRHNGMIVCKMLTNGGSINAANARLIAAAPDLLSVLEEIVAACDQPRTDMARLLATVMTARTIIAKARGVAS